MEFQKEPLHFVRGLWERNGDFVKFKLGPQKMYFVNRPEYISHILLKNQKNYNKKNMMYHEMSLLFGEATSVVDGERWKKGHQLIQPSFASKNLEPMFDVLEHTISATLQQWESKADGKTVVDMGADIHRLTLSIIVETMFGASIEGREEEVTAYFRTILDTVVARILAPVNFPLWVPTPMHRRYKKAVQSLDALIYEIIRQKKDQKTSDLKKNDVKPASKCPYHDMLSQWVTTLSAQGGKSPQESAKMLRDEVIGIFVAAHGSTAVFLSWTFYHLAKHPEIQSRVVNEVAEKIGSRKPVFDDLEQLPYTRQVIEESMRITPPGWVISRSTIGEDRFGDYVVPPKSMILISPYLMHHHPEFWSEPEKFDPERFNPANADQIRKATKEGYYIPFSAGPRICTGKPMAMIECMLIVALTAQKFHVSLKEGHTVTPKGGFTLGLGGNLLVNLKKRSHLSAS
jgi:cytochrome P450